MTNTSLNGTVHNCNCTWHNGHVAREDREKLHGHRGGVVWFTGLPASGKSTIAHLLEKLLYQNGYSAYVFDGDNVRHGLCSDLGFSESDRHENIRRIGEMARLFTDAGIIAITAFISPYRKDRQTVRDLVGKERFIECYMRCPIEVCMLRDPKSLYLRAQRGEIESFTGVSAPYECPEHPDIVIESDKEDPTTAVKKILAGIDAVFKQGFSQKNKQYG